MELLLAPAVRLAMPGMVSGELWGKGFFHLRVLPVLKHSPRFPCHRRGLLEVLPGGNIAGASRSFQAGLGGTVQKDRGAGLRFAAFGGVC